MPPHNGEDEPKRETKQGLRLWGMVKGVLASGVKGKKVGKEAQRE
jgi:hypothetical protein